MINDYLLERGENTLGFVNPALYAAYGNNTSITNDITVGYNGPHIVRYIFSFTKLIVTENGKMRQRWLWCLLWLGCCLRTRNSKLHSINKIFNPLTETSAKKKLENRRTILSSKKNMKRNVYRLKFLSQLFQ